MTYWGAGYEVPERENQASSIRKRRETMVMPTNTSSDAQAVALALLEVAKALETLGCSIEKSHNHGQPYPDK
jgi:hypothetical protein